MAWAGATVGPALLCSFSSDYFCFHLLPSTEVDLSLVNILNPTSVLILQVALVIKNLPANAGDVRDTGSIPASGRSLGRGHGNSLQYSCLENPTDRGAWQATVHGITQSWTQMKRLSTHTQSHSKTYILRLPGVRMQTSYNCILYEKFIFYHQKMKKAVL